MKSIKKLPCFSIAMQCTFHCAGTVLIFDIRHCKYFLTVVHYILIDLIKYILKVI